MIHLNQFTGNVFHWSKFHATRVFITLKINKYCAMLPYCLQQREERREESILVFNENTCLYHATLNTSNLSISNLFWKEYEHRYVSMSYNLSTRNLSMFMIKISIALFVYIIYDHIKMIYVLKYAKVSKNLHKNKIAIKIFLIYHHNNKKVWNHIFSYVYLTIQVLHKLKENKHKNMKLLEVVHTCGK